MIIFDWLFLCTYGLCAHFVAFNFTGNRGVLLESCNISAFFFKRLQTCPPVCSAVTHTSAASAAGLQGGVAVCICHASASVPDTDRPGVHLCAAAQLQPRATPDRSSPHLFTCMYVLVYAQRKRAVALPSRAVELPGRWGSVLPRAAPLPPGVGARPWLPQYRRAAAERACEWGRAELGGLRSHGTAAPRPGFQ